ncbi:hypothetical protein K737_300136 [Holospora undulata HU1]|uniref:Uncharacterized protein n=1 Tax=Holospora undulata HU1 TaxID=1321371 RepID=A0A061JIK4_9PROT|nr:hypothetical protein K737_300136 [Holospora undulata HU1]
MLSCILYEQATRLGVSPSLVIKKSAESSTRTDPEKRSAFSENLKVIPFSDTTWRNTK